MDNAEGAVATAQEWGHCSSNGRSWCRVTADVQGSVQRVQDSQLVEVLGLMSRPMDGVCVVLLMWDFGRVRHTVMLHIGLPGLGAPKKPVMLKVCVQLLLLLLTLPPGRSMFKRRVLM